VLDWFFGELLQEESEVRFVLKRMRLTDFSSVSWILIDQQFLDGTLLVNVKVGGAVEIAGAGGGAAV